MRVMSVAIVLVALSILGIGACSVPLMGQNGSARSLCHCDSTASCESEGARASSEGDVSAAMKCYRAQVGYAEDENSPGQAVRAYDNMSQAYLHMEDYPRAFSWTHLALQVEPQNQTAKRNLLIIRQHVKQWPARPTGIYVRYAGRSLWNTLCVTHSEDRKIHFRLVAFRLSSAWREFGPAAYGDILGDASLIRQGTYLLNGFEDFPDCRVRLSLMPGVVRVFEPTGDCGFGAGVRAGGEYERISATVSTSDQCTDLATP
jgi:hypothetical protein